MGINKGLLWAAALALPIGLAAGFFFGLNSRQVIIASPPLQQARAAAESLGKIAVEAQRDPRFIRDEVSALRKTVGRVDNKDVRRSLNDQLDVVDYKLREQNDRLEESLLKTYAAAEGLRKSISKDTVPPSVAGVAYVQVTDFLRWLGPATVAGLILLLALLSWPGTRNWLGRAKEIEVPGFRINIADPASVRAGVQERFGEVDTAISAAYIDKLKSVDIDHLFAALKSRLDQEFLAAGISLSALTHRATLWVPGFPGWELVQATPYIGNPQPQNQQVVGRRFSVRYGIIGRAWRLRATQYNWDVHNTASALVRDWGLTQREARKQGNGRNSLMAFVVPSNAPDGDPLGIVYLEADGVNSLLPATAAADLGRSIPGDPLGRMQADQLAENIWTPVLHSDAAKHLSGALINLRRAFNWDIKINSADGR